MRCRDDLVVFSSALEGRLTGSSWHLHCHPCTQCAQTVRKRHDWIIAVSLGCFVSLRTSSFWTNWYHLMPSSIHRHLWSSTPILRASIIISKFYIIHLLQTTEWVYIDADMSMRTHVTAVVRACFAALRQIRSVRRSLSRPWFVH